MEPTPLTTISRVVAGRLENVARGDFATGINIDSRRVRPGELFVALPGTNTDGHHFAKHAIENGATACVMNKNEFRLPAIIVDDPLNAMTRLANWYRGRLKMPVVGITGSVGKTTTRELLRAACSVARNVFASPNNFNNEIGLPLSLLGIDPGCEAAVLELAACRTGEIRDLCDIAQPDIGILTAIAPAHLESFGNVENILQTKLELLDAAEISILNGDDPRLSRLTSLPARVLRAGTAEHNDIIAENVRTEFLDEQPLTTFSLRGDTATYHIRAAGAHMVSLAACAIATARELGVSAVDIAEGLMTFEPCSGRGNVRRIGSWTIIDETYNASPASMNTACRSLMMRPCGPRVAVLGDMLELGDQSEHYHRLLGRFVGENSERIDHLIAFGRWAEQIKHGADLVGMPSDRIFVCDGWAELTDAVSHLMATTPDGVMMVKGSRGCRLERLFADLENETTTRAETSRPASVCL